MVGFLPGIFNKQQPAPAPQNQQQQQQQQQLGNQQASQSTGTANNNGNNLANGNVPNQQPNGNAGGPEPVGIDKFADYFKPREVDPKAPKPVTLDDPILNPLDPAKFREQIASANFAASLPQETIQKALGGDAQAFTDAMNHMAREAFFAATSMTHGLVEHGSRTAAQRLDGTLDSRFRNMSIRSQNTSNEVLNSKAVAPVFTLMKRQIAAANPNLTAEQVVAEAEQYFNTVAEALRAPKDKQQQELNAPKVPNFLESLGLDQ
jgi:hypothetical protein